MHLSARTTMKTYPKVLAILLAMTASSGGAASLPPTLSPARDRLSHDHQWFTDAQGRVVMLRGGNVSLPEAADGTTPRTATRMAEQGFNAVRLVVFFRDVMPTPDQVDGGHLERIAATVAAYRAAGIYVLLDFHQDQYGPLVGVRGMPDWAAFTDGHTRIAGMQFPMGYFKDPAVQRAFDNFWANHPVPGTGQGVQDLYVRGLAAAARRFKDDPAVFGIDVMNEPSTGTPCAVPDPAKAHCPELEQTLLAPFYRKAGKALAKAAPDTLIFVEPFMLQGALGLPIDTPMPGVPRLNGLSYHNYGPEKAYRDRTNDAALAHARNVDAALINTEWGFTNDAADVAGQAADFDARLISWVAWPRGRFEALVDPELPDQGNGNRIAILRAYARPYPAATAGTPTRLSYDGVSGTMDYSYATRSSSGRRLPGTLLTEIRIPAINYPQGYRVKVTGAGIVSQPDAPTLLVRNETGARSVRVVVERVGGLPPLPPDPTEPEMPAAAALPPIPARPLNRNSLIGHILATPGGRDVLQTHIPTVLAGIGHFNDANRMPLAAVREFAPQVLTDDVLAAIDADLARLAPDAGPVSPSQRLSSNSLVSDLLRDPDARKILAREVPGLADSEQKGLFPQTSLRALQPSMPKVLTDEVLARIDAALAQMHESHR